MAWSLGACKPSSPNAAPAAAPSVVAPSAAPRAPLLGASSATTEPPVASAVLTALYGDAHADIHADAKIATETDTRTLADGREAAFWYGHRYRYRGQERYTAFAVSAKPNDSGFAAPEDQVALAQVTYLLGDGRWRADGMQQDLGAFGALGRAPEVDRTRTALGHEISAERALLGVPTQFFANGATTHGYALFAIEAKDGRWRALGEINTGEDHSASCRDGPSTPDTACVRNVGVLRFLAAADADGMPSIVVDRSGSVRGSDGEIRMLAATDAVRYRYDAASARYLADSGPP